MSAPELYPHGLLKNHPPLRTEFEARCDRMRKRHQGLHDFQIEGFVRVQMTQRAGKVIVITPNKKDETIPIWQCAACGWTHHLSSQSVRKCGGCGQGWKYVPTMEPPSNTPAKKDKT